MWLGMRSTKSATWWNVRGKKKSESLIFDPLVEQEKKIGIQYRGKLMLEYNPN